jgi:hypothetical protein
MSFVRVVFFRRDLMSYMNMCSTRVRPLAQIGNCPQRQRGFVTDATEDPPTSGPSQCSYQSKKHRQQLCTADVEPLAELVLKLKVNLRL